jgi:hypothetical protein
MMAMAGRIAATRRLAMSLTGQVFLRISASRLHGPPPAKRK